MQANDGERFGALLRQYRLAAGLTQEELAERTAISARAISSMEAGRTARPYRRNVQVLADALALSPGQRALLIRLARAGAAPGPRRPAQLPADIAEFTGRTEQVNSLSALLAASGQPLRIAVITGPGGVGKSALAIHLAHQLSAAFSDGQLFVELQGSSDQPVSTSEVLARLLRQLGMADTAIPADATERAAEFRTRMAELAMLVVLDDARDAAQVRPLLPGNASSAVLITSRGWLADLEGSRALALGALGHSEATTLFGSICGADRVEAEPEATNAVLTACGGLPLAIRIAGARLVSRPAWDVGALANRLRNERQRLSELAVGDLAVRASFQVSYANLPAARQFRLLGLWPGTDVSLPAAAALLGFAVETASELLERLVDVHMLETPAEHRYRFHDLIAVFAAECAEADEPLASREQALTRLLLWYLHTSDRALRALKLFTRAELIFRPAGTVTPLEFDSYDPAAAWCDAERDNVITAVTLAARHGVHDICAQLAESAWRSFLRSPWSGWVQVLELGIASASALGDEAAQAWLHTYMGIALAMQGSHLESVDHYEGALRLAQAAGDRQCETMATANLGTAYKELKRFDDAIVALERALVLDPGSGRGHIVLMNLGVTYLEAGQLDQGTARMEEALSMVNASGDPHSASIGRSLVADAYRQLGRYAEAVRSAEQALEISRQVHDDYHEAAALATLGQVLADSGEPDRAKACLEKAYELADRLGVPEVKQIAASLAALDQPGEK